MIVVVSGVSKTPTPARGGGQGRGVFLIYFIFAIYSEIDSFWSVSVGLRERKIHFLKNMKQMKLRM